MAFHQAAMAQRQNKCFKLGEDKKSGYVEFMSNIEYSKGKAVLVHAKKVTEGVEVRFYSFWTLALNGRSVVSFTLWGKSPGTHSTVCLEAPQMV